MALKTVVQRKDGYHHGDLRAQLVEATRTLVEAKGPDHFSVSEACRAAGVSTAAPYRHFADKQEMLIAVAIEGMWRMHSAMTAAAEGQTPGSIDAIAEIGASYVDFAVTEPGVFRLMFGLTRDHEADPDMMTAGQACYEVLLRQVSARTGIALADPVLRQRSFPLWTMVHGTSFLLIDGKVRAMELSVDIKTMLQNTASRLLGDA